MVLSRPLTIKLHKSARLDIDEILVFTARRFGSKQRTIYKQWLDMAIQRIAHDPDLGKDTDIFPFKRYHISWAGNKGSHCLYYTVNEDTLTIVKVLHQNTDHNSILN